MSRRITPGPEFGPGIGTAWRGDTDTLDIFRDGVRIGTVDSTRDCTGDRWAIVPGMPRVRFGGPDSVSGAIRYVAVHGI